MRQSQQIEFRGKGDGPKPLFLSYTRPHKPVTSQRLAHWVKEILPKAGVNTEVFKAYSVRGASTSAALRKGVSLADILSTADWSRESTFCRFYYREATYPSYCRMAANCTSSSNTLVTQWSIVLFDYLGAYSYRYNYPYSFFVPYTI